MDKKKEMRLAEKVSRSSMIRGHLSHGQRYPSDVVPSVLVKRTTVSTCGTTADNLNILRRYWALVCSPLFT